MSDLIILKSYWGKSENNHELLDKLFRATPSVDVVYVANWIAYDPEMDHFIVRTSLNEDFDSVSFYRPQIRDRKKD